MAAAAAAADGAKEEQVTELHKDTIAKLDAAFPALKRLHKFEAMWDGACQFLTVKEGRDVKWDIPTEEKDYFRKGELDKSTEAFKNIQAMFSPARSLVKVEVIQNRLLEALCSCMMHLYEERRGGSKFNPEELERDAAKKALVDVLKVGLITKKEGSPFSGLKKSNICWAWHGCKSGQDAYNIADTGFANLRQTDSGFFGSGRYLAWEAEYACKYAKEYPSLVPASGSDCWCVLLCLVVLGVTYPLTWSTDDFKNTDKPARNRTAEDCNYLGKALRVPYDSHFVPVEEHGKDYLIAPSNKGTFHELVLDQDAQLLPFAVCWFK